MKRILSTFLLLTIAGSALAETAKLEWWGLVSFRQRHETYREYIDKPADSTRWGDLRLTDNNSLTRVGYQFGFTAGVAEHLSAALTLRSGLGSTMWQDINYKEGLLPGVQEAYLDWETPYAELLAGKFPQQGTAMWDLYAAPLWTDFRQDDPSDGLFNDRISALSGARLLVPVGSATLRGTYHTDFVGGGRRHWPDSNREDQVTERLDQKVFLIGGELKLNEMGGHWMPGRMRGMAITLDGDYGFPYRVSYLNRAGDDSIYADEKLWGANLKAATPRWELQLGYGYNWRDSVFTSDYWDIALSGQARGFRLTTRYQFNIQEVEYGTHKGDQAYRRAIHMYFNKTVWNLDIQPRAIWFITEIDNGRKVWKQKSRLRLEVTATARF